MKIGIIGMGWFGRPFATYCAGQGHNIIGTKRTPEEAVGMQKGVKVLPFEFENCTPTETIESVMSFSDVLVFDIPPSAVSAEVFEENLKSIATQISKSKIQKALFISSTSVFSAVQGMVDEQTEPLPESKNGKLLVALEQMWKSTLGMRGIVIRPGGLIGEERHPVKFLSGRERLKGKGIPVNLVHQDDLVKMVYAIATTKTTQTIFHAVADQHPDKMEYYQTVAERRGLPIPNFEMDDKSEGKTINAEKSKQTLGITFDYEDPFEM